MASRSFLYVLFLFLYLRELSVYGARELAHHRHLLDSKSSISGHSGGSQGLKVTYKHGPCCTDSSCQCNKSPNPRQILKNDKSRVDSLYSRNSNKYFTSQSKEEEDDNAINVSPSHAGVFFVTIGFGTPKKNLNLLIDTGSEVTWVSSKPCSSCQTDQNAFNPFASSTFSNDSCNPPQPTFEILYRDSSYADGNYGCDTIAMDENVYPNFLLGLAQSYQFNFSSDSGAAGVLGLSSKSYAIEKFGNFFCYCLPAKENSNGYLYFGQEASQNCRTDKSVKLFEDVDGNYMVKLIGITVGEKRLNLSSSNSSPEQHTILDSGTVVTWLSPSFYSQVSSAFKESMSQYPSAGQVEQLDTCYNLKGYNNPRIPPVVLHFENSNDIVLDRETVLFKVDDDERDQVFCLAFTANKQDNKAIIGSHQQRKHNFLYDLPNGKLLFGMGNC